MRQKRSCNASWSLFWIILERTLTTKQEYWSEFHLKKEMSLIKNWDLILNQILNIFIQNIFFAYWLYRDRFTDSLMLINNRENCNKLKPFVYTLTSELAMDNQIRNSYKKWQTSFISFKLKIVNIGLDVNKGAKGACPKTNCKICWS